MKGFHVAVHLKRKIGEKGNRGQSEVEERGMRENARVQAHAITGADPLFLIVFPSTKTSPD